MIRFNRIYVIESLPDGEEKTGTELHNDLLRLQGLKYDGFESSLLEPKDKAEWNTVMNVVLDDTKNKGVSPILHFEIHGSADKTGLVLASRELVTWQELRAILEAINIASQMNLFVTLAVCHGAYLLTQYHLNQRAFCYGILGSFDVLRVSDLKIRFHEFYQELFESFDIPKAYQRLLIANPGVQTDYECVSALELFFKVYRNYILEEVENSERVKQRALDAAAAGGIVLTTRQQRRAFQRSFADRLHKTKEQYYMEHSTRYLLLDLFPEKRDEFLLPKTLKEFMSLKVIPTENV